MDYHREFNTEEDARVYANGLPKYLTIIVFESKISKKWIVTAS